MPLTSLQDVVDRVVLDLRIDSRSRMSGDSGLRNVWEELCVQMQGEKSFYWNLYEQHVYSQGLAYIEAWTDDKILLVHQENFKRPTENLEQAKTKLALRVFSRVKTAAKKFRNSNTLEYLKNVDPEECY
jgi:hypothetical protein